MLTDKAKSAREKRAKRRARLKQKRRLQPDKRLRCRFVRGQKGGKRR